MQNLTFGSLLLVSAAAFTILVGFALFNVIWTPLLERHRANFTHSIKRFSRAVKMPEESPGWAKSLSSVLLNMYSDRQKTAMSYFGIKPEGFAFFQLLIMLATFVVLVPLSALPVQRSVPILLVVGGYFLPPRIMMWLFKRKQREVLDDFPAFIAFFRMYIKVGKSNVTVALKNVSGNIKRTLGKELTLLNINIEQSRTLKDAFAILNKRLAMPEIKRFSQALVSAEEHGELVDLFDNQIESIKEIRTASQDERVKNLPFLMVIPAILPVIAIIMLFMLTMGTQFFTQFGPVVGAGS